MRVKFECSFCGAESCDFSMPMGKYCSEEEINILKEEIEGRNPCPAGNENSYWTFKEAIE